MVPVRGHTVVNLQPDGATAILSVPDPRLRLTSPADPIVPTENIFTHIYLQGDAIGTIQNECNTMEDV